jgi:hypothetical protein
MGLDAIDFPNTAERVRLDREQGRLVGSECSNCHRTSWPARAVCYQCHFAPMTIRPFAATGTVVSYTTVWVARPGVPPPFTLGQVTLDDGPLILAHIRDLPDDARVPFDATLVLSEDPGAVPPFWFVPTHTGGTYGPGATVHERIRHRTAL